MRRRLQAMRDRLRNSREGSAIRALVDGAPATSAEIQGSLGGQSVLLEYFSLGDSLVAFVVRREAIEAVSVPVRPGDLLSFRVKYLHVNLNIS